ncbi:hypothetical protein [Treponema sp.]|uniref:hypothetical protein n=1 Tax=Treponema sp. TaxID=166 RepID=UPI00298E8E89|nr:hypothetical protein [Treponema sp.]MCR5613922.1 PQQ-like beta-propeller repeat protein [Treponema sp.]
MLKILNYPGNLYTKRYILISFLGFLVQFLTGFLCFAQTGSADSRLRIASEDVGIDMSAQVKIDELDRSWFSVLGGSPSSKPVLYEYGFLVIQESRLLACYSKNGQLLWQKNMGAKINYMTLTQSGFVIVITQRNQLLLVNPSGLILWKVDLSITPLCAPCSGLDGRIIIKGANEVCCYGIGGALKWTMSVDSLNGMELKTLNDGSILAFLEITYQGKSSALRISPYGTVLEEIIFQGLVVNSFETFQGVMLVFSNGQLGMCSVQKNGSEQSAKLTQPVKKDPQGQSPDLLPGAYSKWINQKLTLTDKTVFYKISRDKTAVYTPGSYLAVVNNQTGTAESSFLVPQFSSSSNVTLYNSKDKYIIYDSENCVAYNSKGTCLKNLKMPSKTGKYSWEYFFYIDTGYIAFLAKNWTLNAFKVISVSEVNENLRASGSHSYSEFLKSDGIRPLSDKFSQSVYKTLEQQNYGIKELYISQNVLNALNAYYYDKSSASLITKDTAFKLDIEYTPMDIENILKLIPLLQSQFFQSELANFIANEKDKALIIRALKSVSECAYDPESEILNQIELLVKRTSPRDKAVLDAAANAVYEICRFMGRPALLKKGKAILSGMFYPQYDESTKKTVRSVMQKLADLDM